MHIDSFEEESFKRIAQVEVDMNRVNSFKCINAQGQVSFGRYRIEPQAGKQFVSAEEIAKAAPATLPMRFVSGWRTRPIQLAH